MKNRVSAPKIIPFLWKYFNRGVGRLFESRNIGRKKFPPEELTLDHIVPVARGGRSTRGNLAVCCRACNQAKKFLTPAELLLRNLESENDGGDNG